MILSLIATKGGGGKSTITECLAFSGAFQKSFPSIAIVELDAQGSIEAWHSTREEEQNKKSSPVGYYNLSKASRREITTRLDEIVNQYECVVLDVPGESTEGFSTLLALNLSDIVIVPLRASDKDESAFFNNLLPLIESTLKKNKDVQFFVIPNFINPSTKPESVADYYNAILPEEVPYLGTFIVNRVIYEGYGLNGLTLREQVQSVKANKRLYAQGRKAVNEIEAAAKKILDHFKEVK